MENKMDKTCAVYHRVLLVAGIQFFAKTNWQSKIILFYHLFCNLVCFLTFFLSGMFVFTNTDQLDLMFRGACILSTSCVQLISIVISLVFKQKFRNFIIEMVFKDSLMEMPLMEFVMASSHNNKLAELKDLVISSLEKLSKTFSLFMKIYLSMCLACSFMYLECCIYLMCVRTDESLRLLIYDMWIPWSLQSYILYIPTIIFNAFAGVLCCIMLPGMQCTIILLICAIIRQLRILRFILENLSDLASEISSSNEGGWDYHSSQIFKQTVDQFIRLKRFSNQFNGICQPYYLVYLLSVMALSCVCSVKIVTMKNKLCVETLRYCVHQFLLAFVLLIFCMLGQEVDNECEKLEIVVTNNWWKFNKSHKTNIKIFQTALGQRMPIYIFGSVKLELFTFIWFAKTASSFFTLMMSVMEED